jgi:flagellin
MTVINTNVNALFSQNAMKVNNRNLSSAMQQLSTGQRINSAKDDAAGLAITNVMTSNIRGLTQAVRNANDGISMLQTAEGAMIEQTNMLQRMRELAVQAGTATYNSAQRGYLQLEFSALTAQIQNIATQTTWNGDNLLDQTNTAITSGNYDFLVGAASGQTITVNIPKVTTSSSGLAISGESISTASGAMSALDAIDTALQSINEARATLGAGINQLTYAADNLNNVIQNTTASRSQILDTDYAVATTKLASSQIIAQAATAMLAQANQSQQGVLALLK